jgi:hypothetical protein
VRATLLALVPCALLAGQAPAAEPWGLENEKVVQLQGRVVDLACELAGDCPPACGGGRRQLGVATADGRLLPLVKGQVNFANGVPDLLPFCGRTLEVDGLLIESPAMPMLFVQNLRADPAAPWQPATAFERDWKAAHGEAEEWFRADPAVKAAIAEKGVLGIPGLKPE